VIGNSPTYISRMSRGGARRPSCSARTRRVRSLVSLMIHALNQYPLSGIPDIGREDSSPTGSCGWAGLAENFKGAEDGCGVTSRERRSQPQARSGLPIEPQIRPLRLVEMPTCASPKLPQSQHHQRGPEVIAVNHW
jgi:hypothetical protein